MSLHSLLKLSLKEISKNSSQVSAVNCIDHCVVLAGPGSGKTKTLTIAIARSLVEDVVEPRGIACITYNNECALEIEERLKHLSIESDNRVFIGTVHSFALTQIIVPYISCIDPDFPTNFRVATRDEINTAKVDAFSKTYKNENYRNIWKTAEKVRRKYVNRQDDSWNNQDESIKKIILTYEKLLHEQGLIDFDDMPLMATRMVIENEWIRKALFAKYPVLFVDEYQDLGTALHELVLQLCFSGDIRLFAVGDPDQSIYRFTGADPSLLKKLSERTDVETVNLPFNYRCGTSIIEASKAALGENRDHCAPEGAHKGVIVFDPVEGDLRLQANFVMHNLIPSIIKKGIRLDEIGILYRNKGDGDLLALHAEKYDIPIVRCDSNALIPRNNRLSRFIEACAFWVTGGWKLAEPTFKKLSYTATSLVYGANYSKKEQELIEEQLMSFLLKTINTTASTHVWLKMFKNELLVIWKKAARTMTDDWSVLETMILRTNDMGNNKDMPLALFCGKQDETYRLNLSTLHSSKGREFEVVILFGMNNGSMPNSYERDGTEDQYEARRLFYVGVTRAKKELHLVFKKKHYSKWVVELYRRLKSKSML